MTTPVRVVIADAVREYLGMVGVATKSQVVVAVAARLGYAQFKVSGVWPLLVESGNLRTTESVWSGVPRSRSLNSDRYRWEGEYTG